MNKKKMGKTLKKVFFTLFLYCFFAFVIIRVYQYYDKIDNNKYYTLYANVKKTDELKEGGVVRLSGVDVGYISKLELMKDFSVKIYMEIDKSIFIPDDSTVAIYTDGLMGDKYVTILPGGSNDYLENGDFFDYAQDSVNISEMLQIGVSQFMDKNKGEK